MSHDFISRNTSCTTRVAKIDTLVEAGFPLTLDPRQPCRLCGDRMGEHLLVIDGELSDSELIDRMLTQRIAGTIESPRPDLPFACATFGGLPRLTP